MAQPLLLHFHSEFPYCYPRAPLAPPLTCHRHLHLAGGVLTLDRLVLTEGYLHNLWSPPQHNQLEDYHQTPSFGIKTSFTFALIHCMPHHTTPIAEVRQSLVFEANPRILFLHPPKEETLLQRLRDVHPDSNPHETC